MKTILFSLLGSLGLLLSSCSTPEQETRSVSPADKRAFYALQHASIPALQMALDHDGNPNARDRYGMTLLQMAVMQKDPAFTQLLLKRGARVNAKDSDGGTAMHSAAGTGRLENMRLLVNAGAKTDAADQKGRTPLMEAVRLGQMETAEFLLDAGADWKRRDKDGLSLVCFAAIAPKNRIRLFDLLSGLKADWEPDSANPRTSPFLRALAAGYEDSSRYLLERIPSFDTPQRQAIGQMAMRFAIRENLLPLVKKLAAKKVLLNFDTPLAFKAVRLLSTEGVYKLMARGDVIDRGYTPLIWAAIYSRPEIAEWLVLQGADPRFESNEGRNALDYANDRATHSAIRNAMKKRQKEQLQKF